VSPGVPSTPTVLAHILRRMSPIIHGRVRDRDRSRIPTGRPCGLGIESLLIDSGTVAESWLLRTGDTANGKLGVIPPAQPSPVQSSPVQSSTGPQRTRRIPAATLSPSDERIGRITRLVSSNLPSEQTSLRIACGYALHRVFCSYIALSLKSRKAAPSMASSPSSQSHGTLR
jgi:hypothetical protein